MLEPGGDSPKDISIRLRQQQRSLDEEPYLHNKHLISGVAPDLKLLVVSLGVLCDPHRTHLREEGRESSRLDRMVFRPRLPKPVAKVNLR